MRKILSFSRLLITFLVLWLSASWFTPRIFAHTEALQTEPAAGAVLWLAPREVSVTFDQPILAGSNLRLFGEGFKEIWLAPYIDEQDPRRLHSILYPRITPGKYTLQWIIIAEDGHVLTGFTTFHVRLDDDWLIALAFCGLVALLLPAKQLWKKRTPWNQSPAEPTQS
ncbi:MAG TPA: copper resistance protein CopC [Anaerolineales bacterium]|nr:copper resistance protein CopC [Anaerolineales bacterium]